MEIFTLLMLVAVGAYALKSREQNRRIALLGSYLGKYQIEKLMEKDEATLSLEETRLLSLLATLAEQYESRANPTSQAAPHQVLAHLMESRDLRHRDIWELFGSRGVASEVINGKRRISKAQAKKLAAFFHVDAGLFI